MMAQVNELSNSHETPHISGGDRNNNFGFLRLLFAFLVIISHSPELIDGNTSREIMTAIFGTITFGSVGVYGFFLISGYLITKSFIETKNIKTYFLKRAFRIIPGYLIAFLICVLFIAPFVGAGMSVFSLSAIKHLLWNLMWLQPPEVDGVFQGLHYPLLDGPIYTIAYEFRCYIGVVLLGLLGYYRPPFRPLLLFVGAELLLFNASGILEKVAPISTSILGSPDKDIRFSAMFMTGMLYYLFRDKISFTNIGAAVSAALLIPMLFNHYLADAAYAILGGYLIFWFAFEVKVFKLSHMINKADISYGVYLYAWPIQNLMVWFNPAINPWILCIISILGASVLGYISWIIVEKPALDFMRKKIAR